MAAPRAVSDSLESPKFTLFVQLSIFKHDSHTFRTSAAPPPPVRSPGRILKLGRERTPRESGLCGKDPRNASHPRYYTLADRFPTFRPAVGGAISEG